jgi:F-type H+-transporting ATPase subunit b
MKRLLSSPRLWLPVVLFAAVAFTLPALASGHPEVLKADGTSAAQSSPLDPHTQLLIWELAAFFLLLAILVIAVFPKMFKAMKERQHRIEGALAKADVVHKEAEELLWKHQKMMTESHGEAKKVTDDAIAAAAKLRAEMIEDAKHEAEKIIINAKNEIRLAQQKAAAELRQQAVELALIASRQVLGRSVNTVDQRELAKQAIDKASAEMSRSGMN